MKKVPGQTVFHLLSIFESTIVNYILFYLKNCNWTAINIMFINLTYPTTAEYLPKLPLLFTQVWALLKSCFIYTSNSSSSIATFVKSFSGNNRTESVASNMNSWGDNSSTAAGRNGEVMDTFDFLIKSKLTVWNHKFLKILKQPSHQSK